MKNIPRKIRKSPSVIKFVKARVTLSVSIKSVRKKEEKKKEHSSTREEKWHFAQQKTRSVLPHLLSSSFPFFSFFHPLFLSPFLSSHPFTHSFVWFSTHAHRHSLSISPRVQMHLNLKLSRVALESYQWTLPLLENESHCRIIAFIAVFISSQNE